MRKQWLIAPLALAALMCAGCPVQDGFNDPSWTPYGMLKLDAASNSELSNPATNNFIWNVTNATTGGGVSMTARNSRFGANLDMGAMDGKVEVDFYNGDVLMRHVYLTMDLGGGMELLVGQTSDVISPLVPSMLNWVVGWRAGNIGHRNPQVRWSYQPGDGPLDIKIALSDPLTANVDTADLQARVGIALSDVMVLGAAVVMGNSDCDNDLSNEDVFAIAADFKAKLGEMFTISAEWFAGTNLSNYQGSIGLAPNPGVTTVDGDLASTGLWAQVTIKLSDAMRVNAGTMFEVIDNDDLDPAAINVQKNGCLFGNIIFKINDRTETGIEVSTWSTDYKNDNEYDNLRVQGSLTMKF